MGFELALLHSYVETCRRNAEFASDPLNRNGDLRVGTYECCGQTWLSRFRANSYIPTFVRSHISAVRAPGHIRTPIGQGRNQAGCAVGPRSCCRAWSRNVGMYESRPFTLSPSPRYGHGKQEFSYILTFLRSYADC